MSHFSLVCPTSPRSVQFSSDLSHFSPQGHSAIIFCTVRIWEHYFSVRVVKRLVELLGSTGPHLWSLLLFDLLELLPLATICRHSPSIVPEGFESRRDYVDASTEDHTQPEILLRPSSVLLLVPAKIVYSGTVALTNKEGDPFLMGCSRASRFSADTRLIGNRHILRHITSGNLLYRK
ncbi:hypothetical protein PoB_001334300 [Plakobranchus ocellatus]|uniref:Uncharacterized protein n=1 Tax=Plakobranchus ocellatus TaxID=259542 RepID=A0AAV3YWC9_9GAST|nr:hypothetical protein PoB_001334300 [Plakobranchus ocellatus]